MPSKKDLSGQKFGKLTVLYEAEPQKSLGRNVSMWHCKCDCGNEKDISIRNLTRTSKPTRSCGCICDAVRKETARAKFFKHGHCSGEGKRDRLYTVWAGMKARCGNPNSSSFKWYGAKGVKVCDAWKSFETFYEWALSSGYKYKLERGLCTIDRIDSFGNYQSDNCRWVDMKTQSNNKRKSICKLMIT